MTKSGARAGRTGEADARAPEGARLRGRVRGALLGLIGLLYVASVPWYRDTAAPWALVFGLPDWVAMALGCYVAVAVLNAVAWLLTDVPDAEAGEGRSAAPDGAEAGAEREP